MKPGRELDALIAEKVMDVTVARFSKTELERGVMVDSVSEDDLYVWDMCEGIRDYYPLPKYSTDISAAWEVVGKLKQKPHLLGLILSVGSGNTLAKFTGTKDHRVHVIGEAYSEEDRCHTPHAICLASLKAVGYEIKTE